jgi:hypothetical protein
MLNLLKLGIVVFAPVVIVVTCAIISGESKFNTAYLASFSFFLGSTVAAVLGLTQMNLN